MTDKALHIGGLRDRLRLLNVNSGEDEIAKVIVEEAIKAVEEGNYGVGACLVDASGTILVRGHNRVFTMGRSDSHAEMSVINSYEDMRRNNPSIVPPPSSVVLYSTVEPCPMCFSRIVASGISKCFYIVDDEKGGMVHCLSGDFLERELPVWYEICGGHRCRERFAKLVCPRELVSIASEVFDLSRSELDPRLKAGFTSTIR